MQSIIVYRNPLEAALWESNLVFPIFVSMAAAVLVAMAAASLFDKLPRKYRDYQGNAVIIAAFSTMLAVLYVMI